MRRIAAVVGYLLLFASIPLGIIVGYFVLAFVPKDTYIPRIAVLLPAVPFVVIAWLFLTLGGQTSEADVGTGIKATLYAGVAAAIGVFAWLFG